MSKTTALALGPQSEIVLEAEARLAQRKPANDIWKTEIESLIQDPRSYTQWATKYLFENRESLVRAIPADFFDLGSNDPNSNDVVDLIITKYLHPYVARNLRLPAGSNWTMKNGDDSTLCKFLHVTAEQWLIEMGKFMLVTVVSGSNKKARHSSLPSNISTPVRKLSTDLILGDLFSGCGLRFKEPDPTLETVQKQIYEAILYLRAKGPLTGTLQDFVCKGLQCPDNKEMNATYQEAGLYMFDTLQDRPIVDRAVDINNRNDVAALVDELIGAISGVTDAVKSADPFVLPNLARTRVVKEKLLVLLQRRAMRGVLDGVEEDRFLSEMDSREHYDGKIHEFIRAYKDAPRFFGRTRKNIQAELESKVVPEKLQSLLILLEKAFGLHEASKVYAKSNNEGQQKGGLICAEIAVVIAERVQRALIDLEAELALGGLIRSDLETLGQDLAALLDGEAVTQLLQQLQLVSTEATLASEARRDVDAITRKA